MKYFIGLISCIFSANCFAQIEIGFSPRALSIINAKNNGLSSDTLYAGAQKVQGVTIWPYQMVDFKIKINTPGHKIFIKDSLEHILYTQTGDSGFYQFKTNQKKEGLDIYDLVNDKTYAFASSGDIDQLSADLEFGKRDVEINVKATLLPYKIANFNKHFVRFLKLGPIMIDEPHFSLSLDKIPEPNIRTDPELEGVTGEDNLVTDVKTYALTKQYVNENKKYLQNDIKGLSYDKLKGWYKIVVDYKQVLYLNSDDASSFLSGLEGYLAKEGADKKVIAEMHKVLSNVP